MPNKKKKYNARFPPARIKKIMQTDEEVGKVAAAVPVIISRALELFVESLIKKTSEITQARNAKTLTTTHLKQCILLESQFDFLKDLVAMVPDVQGDDDSSNPPSDASKPSQYRLKKRRTRKGTSTTDGMAGPSQTANNESEDEDTEEEESDSEEEEEYRSEDNSLPPKSLYLNNQGNINNVRIDPSPNGATPVIVTPASFGSLVPGAAQLDEDYDS